MHFCFAVNVRKRQMRTTLLLKKSVAMLCALCIGASVIACKSDEVKSKSSEKSSSASSEIKTLTDEEVAELTIRVKGADFYCGDSKIWFNGANTPWDNWNDFGGSFDEAFWDEHFAALREAGVNSTRIWFNCSDMVGVKLNSDGSFKEVTDAHWEDCDKLFEIAQKHGIYIMATMLSFDHFKDSNRNYSLWRDMIMSNENIDSFVAGYIKPFAERYDANPYLWSIDLMNEPDWVYENSECGNIGWEYLASYFGRSAAAIHECSDVLVTVGVATIKYNSDMRTGNMICDELLIQESKNELGYLDFYSTHYYSWQSQWYGTAYEKTPEEFGLVTEKPCLIGECAVSDNQSGALEKYTGAYENGWDGILVWTSNGVDDCGNYDLMIEGSLPTYEAHKDEIFPS